MCRNSIIRKNRGFLLVEVLITVVILSVGLTLIARSLMMGLKSLDVIKQYTEGISLLEAKLWDIESQDIIEAGLQVKENFLEPYQKFSYQLETKNLQEDDETGILNQVALSVDWPTKNERRGISVVTYLRNKTQ